MDEAAQATRFIRSQRKKRVPTRAWWTRSRMCSTRSDGDDIMTVEVKGAHFELRAMIPMYTTATGNVVDKQTAWLKQ